MKIVKIISPYEVVINAGANQNIKTNDVFEIYEPGEEIIDPDTKKVIGTLDYIKGYLDIKNIYDNMSICVNHETISTNPLSNFERLFITQSNPKELNIKTEDISGGFENVEKKIQVGDLVRKSSI